jgi:hypothetical protein
MKQLLTPAPDAAAIRLKKTTHAKNQHIYTNTTPHAIERAIADDEAFIAAHPTRQSKKPAPIDQEA